jgi:hypothetical protein
MSFFQPEYGLCEAKARAVKCGGEKPHKELKPDCGFLEAEPP